MSKSRKVDPSRFQNQSKSRPAHVGTRTSKDDFAKLLMDRIHQAGEKGEIAYDPEEFCLRRKGDLRATMPLGNAYNEYITADDADGCDRVVKARVRLWFSAYRQFPEDFQDAKSDLLPVVRSRAYFELASLEHESGVNEPREVLGEHFGIGLAYDFRESIWLVPQAVLNAWGVGFHAALEAAMENLQSLDARFIAPILGNGIYVSASGDSYDASRLLLKDAIRQFHVSGEPIAMIPNRESLIVVGSEDRAGLSKMVRLAREALNGPSPISGIALRFDGDGWTPWMPPPSHPTFKEFERFRFWTLGLDYANQKELLDKLHEKNDEDVFVATFGVIQLPDGRVCSQAAWGQDLDTKLPKTDLVGFVNGGELRLAEWEKVVAVAGDLMEPLGMYPPRYRVREFPSQEQLAAMGNVLK